MHGVFDDEQSHPVERRRDTELTLGPIVLLGLFFVLVLLCGLFFGLGYSVGRHHSQDSSPPAQQAAADASSPGATTPPKPSAAPQSASHPQDRAVVSLSPSQETGGNQPANAQTGGSSAAAGSNFSQPVVKPALPPQPSQFQRRFPPPQIEPFHPVR